MLSRPILVATFAMLKSAPAANGCSEHGSCCETRTRTGECDLALLLFPAAG